MGLTVKLSGRYVILDIGHTECKIVDANIAGTVVTVYKTVDMRDMTPFLSQSGTLSNIEGFVKSLKDTLKQHTITTNRVLIVSSILGISAKIEDASNKAYKDSKELDKHYQEIYGRNVSNISINDYQIYGVVPSESELKYRVMISKATLSLMNDVVATMRDHRLNVVSIESNISALCNLSKFFKYSYDLPSLVLVDIGTVATIYTFKNGAQTIDNKQPLPMCKIATTLADTLQIPFIKAKKLLYTVGAMKSELNINTLYKDNIDADLYFEHILGVFEKTLTTLKGYVEQIISARTLGNTQIKFCGGILDIPGVYELIEANWQDIPVGRIAFENDYTTKTLQVINKLNTSIDAKYALCLGAGVENCLDKSTNLVPKESATVDTSTLAVNFGKGVTVLCTALLVFGLGCSIYNGGVAMYYGKAPAYLATTQQAISQGKALEVEYKSYIDAMMNVDDTVAPLMEFVSTYASSSLRIASIDTPNMLKSAEVVAEVDPVTGLPIVTAPEVTAPPEPVVVEPTPDSTSTSVPSTEETPVVAPPVQEVPVIKPNIILRGYATDANIITEFYSNLEKQSYVTDLVMNGVKQVTLPSLETLYIFEMEIKR